ncbi:MAG: hypothetical protein JNL01_14985 [Bdellovibrionales bacterium]|nr:hypothetical protein [Bdellovibrionales bacterium]
MAIQLAFWAVALPVHLYGLSSHQDSWVIAAAVIAGLGMGAGLGFHFKSGGVPYQRFRTLTAGSAWSVSAYMTALLFQPLLYCATMVFLYFSPAKKISKIRSGHFWLSASIASALALGSVVTSIQFVLGEGQKPFPEYVNRIVFTGAFSQYYMIIAKDVVGFSSFAREFVASKPNLVAPHFPEDKVSSRIIAKQTSNSATQIVLGTAWVVRHHNQHRYRIPADIQGKARDRKRIARATLLTEDLIEYTEKQSFYRPAWTETNPVFIFTPTGFAEWAATISGEKEALAVWRSSFHKVLKSAIQNLKTRSPKSEQKKVADLEGRFDQLVKRGVLRDPATE